MPTFSCLHNILNLYRKAVPHHSPLLPPLITMPHPATFWTSAYSTPIRFARRHAARSLKDSSVPCANVQRVAASSHFAQGCEYLVPLLRLPAVPFPIVEIFHTISPYQNKTPPHRPQPRPRILVLGLHQAHDLPSSLVPRSPFDHKHRKDGTSAVCNLPIFP